MIPDDEFIRVEGVPITKEEIRAVSIGKLRLNKDDVVVDIGCGSGGMTVEIAKRCKFVYAIDVDDKAIETTTKNLKKFGIKNCKVIKGNAKEILNDIDFNKAFIGGTKDIEEIIKTLNKKEIKHIVANTIVLENAIRVISLLEKYNYNVEVVNVSVSYGKKISIGYMMMAKNPITIITGKKG
ncbi:precorrin-6Y C5,15-methyltransferase (decarboxylating) subunit CbiT [Methanotorris igneus]|uniref:Probable cobalt-precorrin-6B C(15)-methyltransferase (decarboxylating) n=1 Tax=Methanotorris igneus (strain DSM 5666 / JCM 11834 / Kol 5) TaxID=880724 RepID=F6BDK5_METIK|nr:precorrin-6Y C5,15-methyltransferase (decarboxylating) subunit CbiT [Methanotorris igneus]AEF96566.1 cobalt-precorrin-6Y C(15)-methyltransferase (decarboxylating) [Methanotorris igneus Kol 5]